MCDIQKVFFKQEVCIEIEQEVDKYVEECYKGIDLLLKSTQQKKNKDTNSVIAGENNVKKEDINTSHENLIDEEIVQKQIQHCYQKESNKFEEQNFQNQANSHIEHGFVSEDREGDIILDQEKISRDPLEEIKSVWTCKFCGRSARGHLNHTCLYCFSPL